MYIGQDVAGSLTFRPLAPGTGDDFEALSGACDGRIAIFPVESEEYARLASDNGLRHLKTMRSKRG